MGRLSSERGKAICNSHLQLLYREMTAATSLTSPFSEEMQLQPSAATARLPAACGCSHTAVASHPAAASALGDPTAVAAATGKAFVGTHHSAAAAAAKEEEGESRSPAAKTNEEEETEGSTAGVGAAVSHAAAHVVEVAPSAAAARNDVADDEAVAAGDVVVGWPAEVPDFFCGDSLVSESMRQYHLPAKTEQGESKKSRQDKQLMALCNFQCKELPPCSSSASLEAGGQLLHWSSACGETFSGHCCHRDVAGAAGGPTEAAAVGDPAVAALLIARTASAAAAAASASATTAAAAAVSAVAGAPSHSGGEEKKRGSTGAEGLQQQSAASVSLPTTAAALQGHLSNFAAAARTWAHPRLQISASAAAATAYTAAASATAAEKESTTAAVAVPANRTAAAAAAAAVELERRGITCPSAHCSAAAATATSVRKKAAAAAPHRGVSGASCGLQLQRRRVSPPSVRFAAAVGPYLGFLCVILTFLTSSAPSFDSFFSPSAAASSPRGCCLSSPQQPASKSHIPAAHLGGGDILGFHEVTPFSVIDAGSPQMPSSSFFSLSSSFSSFSSLGSHVSAAIAAALSVKPSMASFPLSWPLVFAAARPEADLLGRPMEVPGLRWGNLAAGGEAAPREAAPAVAEGAAGAEGALGGGPAAAGGGAAEDPVLAVGAQVPRPGGGAVGAVRDAAAAVQEAVEALRRAAAFREEAPQHDAPVVALGDAVAAIGDAVEALGEAAAAADAGWWRGEEAAEPEQWLNERFLQVESTWRHSGNIRRRLHTREEAEQMETQLQQQQVESLYEFTDFEPEDLEEVRQLLLQQPEYPVQYGTSSMWYFYSMRLFPQLSRLARLRVSSPPLSSASDEEKATARGLRRPPLKKKGKIVGVVGAAQDGHYAYVIMVAVATAHRKRGLARTMLRDALQRASIYTAESRSNPAPEIQMTESQLHVWVTQKGPISLYLSLGYLPVQFVPNYYVSQSITGGYRMTLPIPYDSVENRLRAFYLQQQKLLRMRERKIRKLGGNPAAAREAAVSPILVQTLAAASSQQREQLRDLFKHHLTPLLQAAALDAVGDKRLHSFFFFTSVVEEAGSRGPAAAAHVDSAIFVSRLPEEGVLSGVEFVWTPQSDPRSPLHLFEALLSKLTLAAAEKNSSFSGVQQVLLRINVEDILHLAWCWEAGFRPIKIEVHAQKGSINEHQQQQLLGLTLPWKKPEEFVLQQQTEAIKPQLLALKRQLWELKRAGGQASSIERLRKQQRPAVGRQGASAAALENLLKKGGHAYRAAASLSALLQQQTQRQVGQSAAAYAAPSEVSTADEAEEAQGGRRERKEEEKEEEEEEEGEEEEEEGEREEEGKALAGRWEHVQEGYAARRAARLAKLQQQQKASRHVKKQTTTAEKKKKQTGGEGGRKKKNEEKKEKEEGEEEEEDEEGVREGEPTGGKPSKRKDEEAGGGEEEEGGKDEQQQKQQYRHHWLYMGAIGGALLLLLLLTLMRLLLRRCWCRGLRCCRYGYFSWNRMLRGTADASRRSGTDLDVEDSSREEGGGLPQVSPSKRSSGAPAASRGGSSSSTAAAAASGGGGGGGGGSSVGPPFAAESYKNVSAAAAMQQARRPHVRREGYERVGTAQHMEYLDGDPEEQELPVAR